MDTNVGEPQLTPVEQIVRDALGETDAKTYNGTQNDLDELARRTVAKLDGALTRYPAVEVTAESENLAADIAALLIDKLGEGVAHPSTLLEIGAEAVQIVREGTVESQPHA